ncbi:MAG: hypothetical protein EOP45_03900 [Sphingobacteriaceae bacterium]|nr:MAG: hypothetical protein EOP45_03900 [Sphingobacteriaceae bacterium]
MTDKLKSTSSTIFKVNLWWTIIFIVLKFLEIPLSNSVFIFFYVPVIILGYLGLVILFIFSSIYWIRQRKKAIQPFVPFAFSILAIAFMVFFPFTKIALGIDFRLKYSDREKVVRMITNRNIKYDLKQSSLVEIPSEYKSLSAGSSNVKVEVVDNKICVLFYTFRGLTDNSAGFVYVPDEKIMSRFKVGKFGASNIFYDPIEITKIAEHWYFVSNT